MSEFTFQDESSSHKYRTETPNIIYEIGLTPALIGIYSALKRCAGDNGICTKAEKTLSKELSINKKTLHKFISQLCETNPILEKPLIFCEKRLSQHGDKDTNAITIVDLWPDNYAYFTQDLGGRVKFTQPRVKITQGVGQNLPKGRVKFTHKEEHTKKNTTKKNDVSAAVIFDCLKNDERLTDKDKQDLSRFPEDRVHAALTYADTAKIKSTLIATLIWHCKQEKPIKAKAKVIDLRKQARIDFKHGEEYNGATCWHSPDAICFQRGMTQLILPDMASDYQDKLKEILNKLNIEH